MRTVTLRDLNLGNVQLTTEQKETIRQKAVPILARAALRLVTGRQADNDSLQRPVASGNSPGPKGT